MAYSYANYGAKAPGDTISVPFVFLKRSHVGITVDDVVVTGDKWSWVNDGTILCLSGFPSGTVTRVFRITPVAELPSLQQGTGSFDYKGANDNDTVLLFAAQEREDLESEAAGAIREFDKKYLGGLPSDAAATTAGGSNLEPGTMYWNETANQLRAWGGTSWFIAASFPSSVRLNVADFGVYPDDDPLFVSLAANDANLALAVAASQSARAVLYFNKGNYTLSGQDIAGEWRWSGEGKAVTRIFLPAGSTRAEHFKSVWVGFLGEGSSQIAKPSIVGIGFDGRRASTGTTNGLVFGEITTPGEYGLAPFMFNCYVQNYKGRGLIGRNGRHNAEISYTDLRFNSLGNLQTFSVYDWRFTGGAIGYTDGDDIEFVGSAFMNFINMDLFYGGAGAKPGNGIYAHSGFSNIFITNCTVDQHGLFCIRADGQFSGGEGVITTTNCMFNRPAAAIGGSNAGSSAYFYAENGATIRLIAPTFNTSGVGMVQPPHTCLVGGTPPGRFTVEGASWDGSQPPYTTAFCNNMASVALAKVQGDGLQLAAGGFSAAVFDAEVMRFTTGQTFVFNQMWYQDPGATSSIYDVPDGGVNQKYSRMLHSGTSIVWELLSDALGLGQALIAGVRSGSNFVNVLFNRALNVTSPVGTDAINRAKIAGGASGQPVIISAEGVDPNIDLVMVGKGTGRLVVGPYSSQADAPITGFVEMKDSTGILRKFAIIS
jgi:hypothetical protein